MTLLEWDDHHPEPDEYGDFYKDYIELVGNENVIQALIQQGQQTYAVIKRLTDEETSYRYQDDKWNVKEIIGHLVDTERIMAYRALCISRGEQNPLPGYDHEEYVQNADFSNRSLQSISTEYDALRNANISMFNSFSSDQVTRTGIANDISVSVRALAYIIAGHERHHMNVLEEKYDINISAQPSDH
jgi:uncharacterized damage-inducible protein DinB